MCKKLITFGQEELKFEHRNHKFAIFKGNTRAQLWLLNGKKFETDTHVPSQLKVILHCLSLRGIKQSKTDTCNTIYLIKTMQIFLHIPLPY